MSTATHPLPPSQGLAPWRKPMGTAPNPPFLPLSLGRWKGLPLGPFWLEVYLGSLT